MRFSIAIIFLFFLTACSKSEETRSANDVSGKLKRTVYNEVGTRGYTIINFLYDANNRLAIWDENRVDSSTSPATINFRLKHVYYYNGSSDLPVVDSLFNSSTLNGNPRGLAAYNKFTYDGQNRNVSFNSYSIDDPTGAFVTNLLRETYSYGNNFIRNNRFLYGNGRLNGNGMDTLFLNTTGEIISSKGYINDTSSLNSTTEFGYDTKNNPYSQINVIKHVFTLGGEDVLPIVQKRRNNPVLFVRRYNGTTRINSQTFTYEYSGNGYPITGNLKFERTDGGAPGIKNYRITFEYY